MNCIQKDDFSKNIFNYLDKIYNIHDLLNAYYLQFWKNIYNNDSFVLYKEAITFFKNNNHGNFHSLFGSTIQEYLYKGSCQYFENKKKSSFTHNENIKITSEDLCRLAKNVVHLLDEVYEIVPKTPFELISFRVERRNSNEEIFNLKKGDIYYNISYLMSSIHPLHLFDSPLIPNNKNQIKINYIFIIPEGSKAYYLHNPFFYLWNEEIFQNNLFNNGKNIIAHQENELVLPRGCYWIVKDKIKINDDNICYIMQLLVQPKNEKLEKNKFELPKIILTQKEFLDKNIISKNEFEKIYLDKYINNEIEIKIKSIYFMQKYAEIRKKEKQNIVSEDKQFMIWDIFDKLQEKKIDNKIFLNSFPNLNKYLKQEKIKKGNEIEIFLLPSSFVFYQKMFQEINKKNNIIKIDTPFTFNLHNCNKDIDFIKFIKLYQESTASEIYSTDKIISNREDVVKYIFKHSNEYPLFYILNLKLKKNINVYDLFEDYKKTNPLKKYLYVHSLKIKIEEMERFELGGNRYFCIITGFME
jgi:hypothetical protein